MASIGIPWEWITYFNGTTYIPVYSQYQSDPLWYLYENYTSEYMGEFFRIAGLLGWVGKETGISHSYWRRTQTTYFPKKAAAHCFRQIVLGGGY